MIVVLLDLSVLLGVLVDKISIAVVVHVFQLPNLVYLILVRLVILDLILMLLEQEPVFCKELVGLLLPLNP